MMGEIIDATRAEMEKLEAAIKKVEEERAEYLSELENVRNIFNTHVKAGKVVGYTKYITDIARVQIKYPEFVGNKINDTAIELEATAKDLDGLSKIYQDYGTQDHGIATAMGIIGKAKEDVKAIDSDKSYEHEIGQSNPVNSDIEDNTILFTPQTNEPELSTVSFVDDIPSEEPSKNSSSDSSLESLFNSSNSDMFNDTPTESVDSFDFSNPLAELQEMNKPSNNDKLKVVGVEPAIELSNTSSLDTDLFANNDDYTRTLGRAA